MKRLLGEPLEWFLLLVLAALTMFVFVGCDNYARVTAPDVTVNITTATPGSTVRPAPAPEPAQPATPSVQLPTPNATEPGSTNLLNPPADAGVPFNGDDETVDTPDTSQPC
ncbi:MAG TPA: hypothetical protein VM756_05425, partial [Burkholderiales bacterium]|nr:hypothetical protein [Burkholderiales bacterium]